MDDPDDHDRSPASEPPPAPDSAAPNPPPQAAVSSPPPLPPGARERYALDGVNADE
ncbi:MAG: hypothetical protein HYV42_01820 [Candidatus Magasanikbacteria bacterium]|nr:hypothetical protein [Candidatus Magasanikbacteria bacterium]